MRHSWIPALLLSVAAASATQNVFTFTGEIANATDVSKIGQAVTFTVTFSGNPTPAGSSMAYNGGYFWFDESVTQNVDLFSSVTGTGITGAWVRPSSIDGAPFSRVFYNVVELSTFMGSDNGAGIGLSFYGSTILSMTLVYNPVDGFASGPASADYSAAWSGLAGSHPVSSALQNSSITTANDNYTIWITGGSSQAVPESSTYGLALGGMTLALVAVRRRKRA